MIDSKYPINIHFFKNKEYYILPTISIQKLSSCQGRYHYNFAYDYYNIKLILLNMEVIISLKYNYTIYRYRNQKMYLFKNSVINLLKRK